MAADTTTILRDVTYALGDNPLGDPSGTAYDDHTIINFAGGRHRVHASGGYLRGAVKYASNYLENRARWLFDRMRAALLPSRLQLSGTGTHPLVEWSGYENVADQYRGGQSGLRWGRGATILLWRHLSTRIINTGVANAPHGGRTGGQFTIDLTAAVLPPLATIEGLALYIQNNVHTTDTKVEWFSDDFVSLYESATVPGGARGKVTISKKELTIIDGKLRVRITKLGAGDDGTIRALAIYYFPYST